ncbi:MAG: SusC/RagA family TonB-linked outer membrane protein [Gemmatimonadota bacterium]|nr:SusC/RagA family TonB-linked outer membrane protein [Gemmatimonadota bacterium]
MTVNNVVRWGSAVLVVALLAGAAPVHAQNAVITGQVLSEVGEPLEGANVFITELNLSTGTNQAGRYTINVPAARATGQQVMLRVRYIGHVPQARQIALAADQTQTQNFSLKVDVNRLSEVVVTGVTAGTQQAKVPFNVSRVDVADLPVPAANPLSQIQGKVPGATIVSGSGRPGAAPAVILRGPSSINASGRGQEPLYVVDGVVLTGSLPDLNPLDIESVEVVKGAAAATLYGARAGNGVIQITTKRGRDVAEGVRFNLRSEYGESDIEKQFLLARTHTLLTDETGTLFCQSVAAQPTCSRVFDYRKEAERINSAVGDFALTPAGFPIDPGASTPAVALLSQFQTKAWPGATFNAIDQVVDAQPYYQNTIDMTGRFGGTNVFASVSNLRQEGAIRFLDGYTRSSARVNLDQQIGDRWNVSLSTHYNKSNEDGFNQESGGTAFFRLTRVPAIANILQTDEFGRLYVRPNLQASGSQNENPLQSLQGIDREDVTDRFIGGATVRYTPLDWLDVEGTFGYDGQRIQFEQFTDKGFRTTQSGFTAYVGSIFQGAATAESYNAGGGLTIRRGFATDLLTRWNLRYGYGQRDFDNRTLFGNTLAVQGVTAPSNAPANRSIGGFSQSLRQVAFSGGANLEYKERYIIDGLIRRDGSSLFGSEARWATYGRGSVAWRAAQEPWWPFPQTSEFKLRASYGTAGNSPAFVSQYETFAVTTGGIVQPVQSGNRLLQPEKVAELELGADIEILNRVGLTLTYAASETEDQILPVPASVGTGFETRWLNAGILESDTWEASLNLPVITRRDFTYSTRLNYDRTRTYVKQLDVPEFRIGTALQATGSMFKIAEGERFGTFYGRAFMTNCSQMPSAFQAQCGDGRAFQRNDDGYIVWVGEGYSWRDGITENLWRAQLAATASPYPGVALRWGMPIILRESNSTVAQNVALGHALPDYQVSMSHNLTWKRFSGYGLLQGAHGQSVWNQARHWSLLDYLSLEVDQTNKDVDRAKPIGYYWRAAPPDQAGLGGLYDLLAPSNHTVEDASFMKLREASVSYRIGPVSGVGDWSLSLIGRNLKTWSDYKGFDPEVGISGGESSSAAINAVDAFTFPNTRSYTLSLSTSF